MSRFSNARRHFAQRLSPVAGICLLAGYLPVQLLAGQSNVSTADTHRYFRRYQASAYITFFSVNIFSRTGVGFASVKSDEEVFPDRRDISLQFLSGSIPERAHGLNRFGFIQESVTERAHVFAEAGYFGLITANGEDSLSQAKAALNSKSQTTPFVAAQAIIDIQSARYSIRHLALSSAYRGADAEQLLDQVHAAFNRPEEGQSEHSQLLNGSSMGTFLYSVRQAMLSPANEIQTRFIYNGKTFSMLSEKRVDEKVGRELQIAGLIEHAASAIQLNGSIRNEKTNEVTSFRLWFDNSSADVLPLRFEFRAKSYLRLVFQALPVDPPLNSPHVKKTLVNSFR